METKNQPLFPMFDKEIIKEDKKFIVFLIILSTCIITFYSFKITHALKPQIYQQGSFSFIFIVFLTLLTITPLFLLAFIQFILFFLTLSVECELPIFYPVLTIIKLTDHKTYDYKPLFIKPNSLLRC